MQKSTLVWHYLSAHRLPFSQEITEQRGRLLWSPELLPQPPKSSTPPHLLCSDCWKLGTAARSRRPLAV